MQSSRVGDYTIYYENTEEFRIIKREVFTNHTYYIELENEKPKIIDLGAYIGDTVLYFKKLCPQALITAVEPLPQNIELLRKNVLENQLSRVEIIEAAVGNRRGLIDFYLDENKNGWYTLAGIMKGGWGSQQQSKKIQVKSIRLDDLIKSKIDLLKMDVEGAEEAVLVACKKLHLVRNIILEYHPVKGNSEENILKLLQNNLFKIEVQDDPGGWGDGLKLIRAVRK